MPHWLPQHAIFALSPQHEFPFAPHWLLPEQQAAAEALALVRTHLAASPQHDFPAFALHIAAISPFFACFEWQHAL
jgi:hypothetical protein